MPNRCDLCVIFIPFRSLSSFAGRATRGPGQHRKVRLASCGADENAPGADLEETRARPVRAGPHAAPESGKLFAAFLLFFFLAYNGCCVRSVMTRMQL